MNAGYPVELEPSCLMARDRGKAHATIGNPLAYYTLPLADWRFSYMANNAFTSSQHLSIDDPGRDSVDVDLSLIRANPADCVMLITAALLAQ